MPQTVDEETPLICNQSQQNDQKHRRTPLPWDQFSILFLLQLSEPMTSQVIAPFLPQLVKDIGITDGKDSRIGYYVGLMHSLFFFTEACTVFHWSRTSDRIGRRPVLLTGLLGLSASMWCFGLSRTFWSLVLSRCLNGALNGNIGVMKSMAIEITDSTNVAYAFGILPVAWSLGATVGPLIGGSLARPAERFPEIFGHSAFFKEYAYFLPCSVSGTVTALLWLIAFSFLKETVEPRITLKQYFVGGTTGVDKSRGNTTVHRVLGSSTGPATEEEQLPFRALLVRPVIIAAGSYAMYSITDISLRAVIPVFYAMPIEMGGLSLDPPIIGIILALLGISGGIIQWLLFAPMYDWFGPRMLYLVTVSMCIPMVALFPVTNAVARVYGLDYFVWCLLGLQMVLFIFAGFAFSVAFVFVSAAAPNKASLGATNGIAQVVVSVMRAIGPATINSAFSLSIEDHIMGGNFAYFVMVILVGLTLWVGCLLPQNLRNE